MTTGAEAITAFRALLRKTDIPKNYFLDYCGKTIVRHSRKFIPTGKGPPTKGKRLRSSLTYTVNPSANRVTVLAPQDYAAIYHNGHRALTIRAKKGKPFRWLANTPTFRNAKGDRRRKWVYAMEIKIPAWPGNPFFTKGIESAKPDILREMKRIGRAFVKRIAEAKSSSAGGEV